MTFSPSVERRPSDQYWQRHHGNGVSFSSQSPDLIPSGLVVPPVTPQQASEFITGGQRRRNNSRNPIRSILRRRQGDVMMSGVSQGYPHKDSADNVAYTGLISPQSFGTYHRIPTQANEGPAYTPFAFTTRLPSYQDGSSWASLGDPRNLPDAYGVYLPYHANVAQGTPINTPSYVAPVLPYEPPSLYQWNFPSGVSVWKPHPAPHPSIPASKFWGSSNILQGLPQTPYQYPTTPLHFSQLAQITGGHPLPGQDASWTPGNFPTNLWGGAPVPVRLNPLLIPNPVNPELPHLVWDISQNPSRTRRITGAHTIISARPQLNEQAIVPDTHVVYIALQASIVQQLWGPIKILKQTTVTAGDILFAIYDYFQTPLTHAEVDFLSGLHPDNYPRLVDAWMARCNVTPALPGFEARQGLKRVDILGDRRCWWGCWVCVDQASGSWYLNLGLVNLLPGLDQ